MDETNYFAFVLMPFDSAFDDVYSLGIKGAVAGIDGMIAERVDEQKYREGILERIYRQIEVADVIIADMSGQNPNVFYEVGYAHAKGKLCILLTSKAEDIPFDLKNRRHIVYGKSVAKLKDELENELIWARDEIDKQRESHLKVTFKELDGTGALDKTKYSATAKLPFVFDFENTSDDRAIEIQAIYFYTSDKWSLYQEEKECARTVADGTILARGFKRRHFLHPPLQCLQRGAWAQLRFETRSTLAWAFGGQELLDTYRLRGIGILRIVTTDGNFDHEISIDVEVNEIPF